LKIPPHAFAAVDLVHTNIPSTIHHSPQRKGNREMRDLSETPFMVDQRADSAKNSAQQDMYDRHTSSSGLLHTSPAMHRLFSDESIAMAHDALERICEAGMPAGGLPGEASMTPLSGAQTPYEAKMSFSKSCFECTRIPGLRLLELAQILRRRSNCSRGALLVAVMLMARYLQRSGTAPTLAVMHRLYSACLHVGMKAHSDMFYRNAQFAKIVGLEVGELYQQEIEVLEGTHWRVLVTYDDLERMITRIRDGVRSGCTPDLSLFSEAPASPHGPSLPSFDVSASVSRQLLTVPDSTNPFGSFGTTPQDSMVLEEIEDGAHLPPAPGLPGVTCSMALQASSSGSQSFSESPQLPKIAVTSSPTDVDSVFQGPCASSG
jgi:hypothetical protein